MILKLSICIFYLIRRAALKKTNCSQLKKCALTPLSFLLLKLAIVGGCQKVGLSCSGITYPVCFPNVPLNSPAITFNVPAAEKKIVRICTFQHSVFFQVNICYQYFLVCINN